MSGSDFSVWREALSRAAAPVLRGVKPDAANVTLGTPAAMLLLENDATLHTSLAEGMRTLAMIGRAAKDVWPMVPDQQGHRRPVYHTLVLHLHLAAFTRRYEALSPGVWSACEDALPDATLPVRAVEQYAAAAPPPEVTDLVLWQSLCLLEQAIASGRDVDVEVVDGVVHGIVSRPGPGGSLHPRDGEESLDAWTYRELCGLHALANLALLRRNRVWAGCVERVAMHHVENTQPDNTTTQPWAWFGFFWSPTTRGFAEQQMHDATTQGVGTVAAMLLADAADALSQFAH